MKKNFYLILLTYLISKNIFSHTQVIPFREKEIFTDDFVEILNDENSHLAIISGAGPSGLTAALTLEKTGLFTHIIITEKRKKFDRVNETNLQVNSLSWLKKLNIADEIIEAAVFLPKCSVIINNLNKERKSIITTNNRDIPLIDYKLSVDNIFGGDAKASYIIPLWKMQAVLAKKVVEFDNIYLINADIKLNNCESGTCGAFLNFNNSHFNLLSPKLIVIAEGANSINRSNMGIDTIKSDRPDEKFCIGAVSLEGIIPNNFEPHASIVIDEPKDNVYAFFNPLLHEVFINGFMDKDESGEECVKRVTYNAMKSQSVIALKLPSSKDALMVKQNTTSIVDLEFKYASNIGLANNAVLIGEAFFNGSPIGGFGMSFSVSIEQFYLTKLVKAAYKNTKSIQHYLSGYYEKMLKVAKFWHNYGRIH